MKPIWLLLIVADMVITDRSLYFHTENTGSVV